MQPAPAHRREFATCNLARRPSYNKNVDSSLASSSARQSKSGPFPCYVGGFILHSSRIATEVSLPSLRRVVIENVTPEVDGGRFAIKRVVGESVVVEADINADGHQVLDAVLCFRAAGERSWSETPMRAIGNDRWQGRFQVPEFKPYSYTVQAWLDPYKTWIRDLAQESRRRTGRLARLSRGSESRQRRGNPSANVGRTEASRFVGRS